VVADLPRAIDFSVHYTHEDLGRFVETQGTYVRPDRWSSRTEVRDLTARKTYVLHTRSIGSAQWMQMDDWVGRVGCWLELTPAEVPVGYAYMTPGRPVPIHLLGELSRTRRGYAVPYRLAVRMFNGQLIERARLDEVDEPETPVKVYLRFTGGSLLDITVFGEDLVAALPRRHPGRRTLRAFTDALTVSVGFQDGSPRPVVTPREDLVFTEDEGTCRPPVA
jgi:hypothetical protein